MTGDDRGLLALYYAERAELEPLLYSITERACKLLRGRGGGLYLYDRPRREAVCVVSYNTPQDYRGLRLRLGEGAAGRVIQSGEPLIIDDYRGWESRAEAFEEDRPFTAVISAPLKWEDETIGVIHVLDDAAGRTFTKADLGLLHLFADQAATTLKNVKLYRESRRRAEGLAALHRISLKLVAQRELSPLLEEIVRSADELLEATSGGVYLYNQGREELELVLSLGLGRDYRGTKLKLGEGLAGRVAQSGEPQIIENYRDWEGRSPQYAAEPITSIISVPLEAKGQLVGVLNIHTDEEDRVFDEGDLELALLFADQVAIAIENIRLYQEERRQARELGALTRVSRALSSSLELEEVLEKALDEMLQVSGLEAGGIYLLDEEREELDLLVHRGGVAQVAEQLKRHRLGQGLTGRAAAERRVIVCPDLLKEFPELRELIEQGKLRSQISLPLSVKGNLLGVLNLNGPQVYTPSEEELRILTLISEQVAWAIENARLYREEQQRVRHEAALATVGQALSQSLEVEQLLDKALEGLLGVLELDLGGVYLIEAEQFVLKAHCGLSSEFARAAARNPLDHPILGRAIRSREPLEVSEFTSSLTAEEGIKHAVYIPLSVQDKPLGVLIIGDRSGRSLSPQELELLETVGSHLALALGQAELHRRLDASYRRVQVAYKVARLASSSLDPEEVLRRLIRTVVDELEFEVGYITTYSEEEHVFLVRHIYPQDERLAEALRLLGIEDLEGFRFPSVGEALEQLEAWRRGEIIVASSLHEFLKPHIPPEAAEAAQELYGMRRIVELPLRPRGQVEGTILLASRRARIAEETLQLLRMIADQAATALQNAQLYRETAELQEKYRSLVENELVGIYIIQDGKLKYVNEGICRIFGYSREELLDRDPLDLTHPEDRHLVQERLRERIAGEKELARYTFRGVRKDGTVFDCEVLGRRIDYEGRPAVQGILLDVSLVKGAERFRRGLLEVAGEILASYDIGQILQRVAEAVVEHSPFQRAAISLYDLRHEPPLEGALTQVIAVGLTIEEEQQLRRSGGLTPERRKLAFNEAFRIGNSYYIPHDRVPWEPGLGVPGRVSLDGWHPEDFLFIPLRGERGIIGHISVDDPTTPRAPTLEMLEPLEVFAGLAALAVERAARLEELRRQKERIEGIYDFSYQLVRESELEELFQRALEMLEGEFNYDYATIMLLDGRELEVVAERLRFRGGKSFLGRRLALGEGLSGWAAEHRRSALVNDGSQDPRFIPSFKEIQSELIAPLLFGEELLGVVDVESRRRGAFTPEDEELLDSIAAQLAVAIREIRTRQRLRGAYHIGQELTRYRTLEELLSGILGILKREFHYDYGAVLLLRGEELMVAAVESILADRRIDLEARIPLDRGITGWVARHRQPALVNDVTVDPRYIMGHKEIRSELAIPIQLEDELLGVLNIESTAQNRFRPEDQEFLTSVAAQLAVAIKEIHEREALEELSIRDPLTGLYNRRHLSETVARELERGRRYGHSLALLMIDLDDFRCVNNRYGHLKGDEVLRQIAQLLVRNVRAADIVFRYGGDEFLILMPETEGEAQRAIGRLKRAVEEWNAKSGLEVRVGISIGATTWSPGDPCGVEELLAEADRWMYQAKGEG